MGGIDDAVHLEYTAPQIIEPPVVKGGKLSGYGKGVKTKAEFKAEEAFPHGTTGDYKDITMEGSNVVTKVDDLYSDTSALKQFGTNKTLSKKELEIAKQKQKRVNEINNDLGEQSQLLPEPPDPDFASGGRVPFSKGKLALLEGLGKLMDDFFPGTTKLGKRSKPFPGKVQEKMDLRKALAGFKKREEAAKLKELKTWENPDKVRAAVDDIFSTGDYKMDAQMAAEALVENNPKAFGNKLYDDLDDRTRMKIYGAVLEVVQSDLGKMLQLKRASKPTKTLEGIKKTGTIDISDPNIAEEFTKFMKETDPKGYAKIQKVVDDANQQLELKRFKTKGRKPNAEGGLAGMLGE